MSEFPVSWTLISFGDLNEFTSSTVNPTRRSDETFDLFSVPSFPTGAPEKLKGSAIGSTKQTVKPGDVLVCKINPRINRVWAVGRKEENEQIASSEWIGFRSQAIIPNYARHYFSSPRFRELLESDVAGVGGSLTRAQPKKVMTYPVPVAPLAEQTRIADQLDTLLARINACHNRLDNIPALLKRFREAVLVNGITGELTAEWRTTQLPISSGEELLRLLKADHEEAGGHQRGNASDPTEEAHDLSLDDIPNGWEISTLLDCCRPGRPITYGILKPGPELEEGVPYVRVADFPGNQLNLSSIKKTSPEIDLQYKRARLSAGDLLLSIRGSVGRLIVIPPSLEGANITQDTARLSISSRLNARYIYYALLSPDAQRRMTKAIRGVAVRGINIGDVRALQVPLPSLPEQDEIVRRIDALFEIAARIEAGHAIARKQVSRLTPLTLAKAFRGELVPQDPNDEPAKVLLNRIVDARSKRAAVPKPKRQPKGSELKPASDRSLLEIIDQYNETDFSFNELRQATSLGYESLKNELFALLADPKSGVSQHFDVKEKTMKLRRVRK